MYVFIHNFGEFYTSNYKKEELEAEDDPFMQDIL